MNLKKSDLLEIYHLLLKSRRLTERARELCHEKMRKGKPVGNVHCRKGHEAIGVGACYDLPEKDIVQPYYRTSGARLAKGVSVEILMKELLGKKGGTTNGKSLYMHTVEPENILNFSGVVGNQLPLATGVALASKLREKRRVILTFFGDGHVDIGDFHEALNFAGVWDLPIVFICENNRYQRRTFIKNVCSQPEIAERAKAYNMPGKSINGRDVLTVFENVKKAVETARNGGGPSLIECKVDRLAPHHEKSPPPNEQEINEQKQKKDPVKRFKDYLLKNGILDENKISEIEQKINREIKEAVKIAEEEQYPPSTELYQNVYTKKGTKKGKTISSPSSKKEREITYSESINEAIKEEMQKDDMVFLLGEDITEGYYVTQNIAKDFGKDRVIDTPIAESGIVGLGIGAAMRGMRPIIEIQYGDFVTLAMDQIVNNAAKMRYAYDGKINVPIVIRLPEGGGKQEGMVHSQSLESWFMGVPGLKLIYPSTPFDAKGLMKTAIRDEDPVIFVEHKLLYSNRGSVPKREYQIPIGEADIKKKGEDVTVIAIGACLHEALVAAENLKEQKISVEVIDPRTLLPLDKETLTNSVKKTGRAIIVSEGYRGGTPAGRISAFLSSETFNYLRNPVKQITNPFTPIPFSPPLEDEWLLPTKKKSIEKAIRNLV